MSAVGAVLDRKDIPALVRFEKRAVQDMRVTDRYASMDVEFAIITPAYSKDEIIKKVSAWLKDLEQKVREDRMSPERADQYRAKYKAWQDGQEIPLDGTPIKGWPVISPAQQENLIQIKVMTVEMLAGMNDEGIRRYGMGGLDLKNKAVAWLSQAQDKGPLTMENAKLKQEIAILSGSVEALTKQMEAMAQTIRAQQIPSLPVQPYIPLAGMNDESVRGLRPQQISPIPTQPYVPSITLDNDPPIRPSRKRHEA